MLISCKNHLTNGMQSKNGPASRFFYILASLD